MPTLDEACRTLRVSRHTLRKWMKRLGITPERHPRDYRYWLLTSEQVETIRAARAEMPGAIISIASKPAFDRSPTAETGVGVHVPMFTPTPRPRPLQRDTFTTLPDGMLSRTDAASLHNVPMTTLRRWCDAGLVETASATYGGEHGQFSIARPLTRQGLRQFWHLAHGRSDFTPCRDCPHTPPEDAPGDLGAVAEE